MKIIVGLGNPGKEYEKTRHNAGFLVLDLLRKELGFPAFANKKRFFSEISQGTYEGEEILLVKPQTFMNESGKSLSAIVRFYQIPQENLWIIYDDIDLIEGTFRIREKGSSGTHNGMKSIIKQLGHGNFPRFRVGIAKEPMRKDIVKFILAPLTGEAWKCFETNLKTMPKIVKEALKEELEKVMNKYN